MIITLKSADFSKNNINDLLNTFSVSYSGTGVTGTPRSIAKENGVATESLSATITIASNYTYESLTVRVGGTTLTAGTDYTVSGTGPVTLSIPAAKITGNVVVSVQTSGAGGDVVDPDEPGGEINEDVSVTFYDYSNGNDWYVMYSKADETAGTTIRYGLNTSNSTKAKNYVCDLEDGATYRIAFKNNTTGAYRCRMVTFEQSYNNIVKSALSADANTGTTTTNAIYYDRDNTVAEYTTTFTNTLNHKTLAMTLGWATTAGGDVDIDVTVTKISAGGNSETDEGTVISGTFVEGDTTAANDWYVFKQDGSENAYIRTSNSGKAKNVIYNLEEGATYRFTFTNTSGDSTARARIALFGTEFSNIIRAPLSSDGSEDYSSYTPSVQIIHYANETSFEGTFTNTVGAKIMVATIGWAAAAHGSVDLTYELVKIS